MELPNGAPLKPITEALLDRRATAHFTREAPIHQGGYQKAALNDWWSWIDQQVAGGRDVYVYFNNDAEAHAVYDALQLKKLAGFNVGREIGGYLQGRQGESETQTRSSGEPTGLRAEHR